MPFYSVTCWLIRSLVISCIFFAKIVMHPQFIHILNIVGKFIHNSLFASFVTLHFLYWNCDSSTTHTSFLQHVSLDLACILPVYNYSVLCILFCCLFHCDVASSLLKLWFIHHRHIVITERKFRFIVYLLATIIPFCVFSIILLLITAIVTLHILCWNCGSFITNISWLHRW